jgi:hypothetical protein
MAGFALQRHSSLIVVLAVAIALAGLAFAPAAMAMQSDGVGMTGMAHGEPCPGCDHSKAGLADCAGMVCDAALAVLPAVFVIQPTLPAAFPVVADTEAREISIPPPLGPPRPLHVR